MRCENSDVGKFVFNVLTTVVTGGIWANSSKAELIDCTKISDELLVTSTVHDVICMFHENYR